MKKFDVKKLLVLLVIIALIIGGIFLVVKLLGKDELTKEETNSVESSVDYYVSMTTGYASTYGGQDILFENDSVTFETLAPEVVINTAVRYIRENNIDHSVDSGIMAGLEATGNYSKLASSEIYTGTSIRQATKDLFGVEYANIVAEDSYFLYDIDYNLSYDVYLVTRNDVEDPSLNSASMDYKVINTEKKDDKVVVTVAIAYVYTNGDNTMYLKDPAGEKIVVENVKDNKFPEDKVNEFDKYAFTLKKADDNKYVFESMEKVK